MNSRRIQEICVGSSVSSPATLVTHDLTPSEEVTIDATVLTWHPLNLSLHIWHPRMSWLESLIENKLQRGDSDAFVSNVTAYIALIDDLTCQALDDVVEQQNTKQERINHALPAVIVVSTLLYFWQPAIGISIDFACIVGLFAWCWVVESRKKQLFNVIDTLEDSRPERCRQYCESRVAANNGAVANA